VVVDKATNSLIFQSTPEEYGQVAALLERLDRPTRSALIEVTVAELSLNDSSQLGIEWLLSSVDSAGRTSSMGTLGTLGVGNSGFNFRVLNGAGQLRLALNALASDNRATILSSPRVMARNGELATIQVGQEVPIITSQQSTAVPGSSGAGLLQTVQYRSAGVILRVKPSIHSGDQLDLDVSQEVSQAQATETGVANSPTFSTRRVETKLSVRSGSTVMLGGLISEDASRGSAGVPFLKDIPGIGAAVGVVVNYRLINKLGKTAMNAYRMRWVEEQKSIQG
jgi:general secretion pathway protein D